jgi:hypothetical protein
VDFFEGAKFCSETGGLKWKGSKLCNSPIFQELDTQNCQILLSQVGLRIWPIAKCFQVSDTSNLAASYVLYTLYIYIWLCMYMIMYIWYMNDCVCIWYYVYIWQPGMNAGIPKSWMMKNFYKAWIINTDWDVF